MDNTSTQPQQEPVSKITLDDLYGSTPQTQIPDLPQFQQTRKLSAAQPPQELEPEISLPPDNPPETPPPNGFNRLFILRIFLAGFGIILFVIIIMFVVTFISSVFLKGVSSKVSLTYWGLWEDSNTMQSIINSFERLHPEISINYEKEDPKQYSQRLLTRIQQGNGPDIFTYHSSWLPMVKTSLSPIPNSVITKNDLQNNFYPVVTNDLVKNGGLYGIPLEVDTLSLFVSNSLLQNAKLQAPTTWDNFATVARSLTQKDSTGKIKIAGAALGTFDNITHAPDIISALFLQNGVNIPTLTPKSNATDALTFYTSFATGDSKVWDNTLDPSQLAFSKGNLAMYFGYSWDVFAIKALNPNLNFSVVPIPHLPGRNTSTASYWVEGVSVKSIHQKEAMLFMNFLSQKNTQAILFSEESKTRLFGEPYSRSDLGNQLQNNPLVYPFVSQAVNASSSFFAGETYDSGINAQMNGYLGNAVRSILNNISADTATDTLTQGVQQVENQYASQ